MCPGVAPAKVVVLGGGVSGTHAVEMAVGLRADVTVVDRSVKRLRELSAIFGSQLKTVYSTAHAIEELVRDADLVIGAVLIAGAAAPKLVTRAMVKTMKPGAVLVDIAIDQGGCFETSRPTTHAEPTYVLDGVIHYASPTCRARCRRTSTFALTNATLPYVKALADHGWRAAISKDPGLAQRPQCACRSIDARGGRERARAGLSGVSRSVALRRRTPGWGSIIEQGVNEEKAACTEISSCHACGTPRSSGRGHAALSEEVRPRRRFGAPHQRRGRRLDRLDQPPFSEQVRIDSGDLRDPGALIAGLDLRAGADNRAASPRERLSDFFRASFAPELLDPQLFNVWVVFWSMVAHSREIREVHDRTYGKYRSILEALLGELVEIRRGARN